MHKQHMEGLCFALCPFPYHAWCFCGCCCMDIFAGWQKLTAASPHLHYISPECAQVWDSLVTTVS